MGGFHQKQKGSDQQEMIILGSCIMLGAACGIGGWH
jgi:hypothetical protein